MSTTPAEKAFDTACAELKAATAAAKKARGSARWSAYPALRAAQEKHEAAAAACRAEQEALQRAHRRAEREEALNRLRAKAARQGDLF